ncbi:MAG: hypothetical protein ACKVZ0_12140 [Gemmatimonadales bacterium]
MRHSTAIAVLSLFGLTACSESGSGPEGTGRVVLQLATVPKGAAAASSSAAADLVITRVQLVARKLRMAQASDACPQAEDDSNTEGAGECPAIKAGPLLLDPPVTDGAVEAFTADLPAGTYNRIRFQIHKPTGSNDQAFLQANPGFEGVSIKVEGTYHLQPFTFTTALTTVQEIQLAAPVVVVDGAPVELTVLLDVKGWFADQAGTGWVDPSALTQQLRSRIEQNIRNSFRAFRDTNRDGSQD